MELDELVDKNYRSLNSTDLEIWKYISNHRDEVANYTIAELAQACYVSKATIMRFTQKLSLSGYAELKTRLKLEVNRQFLSSSDDLSFLPAVYAQVGSDIQNKNLDDAFQHIYNAEHVYAVSTGIIQNGVVDEMIRLFSITGDYFVNLKGVGEARRSLNKAKKNDVCILVSLSGEKEEMIQLARRLKLRGVYLISFTKFKNNRLAALTDENIYVLTAQLPLMEQIGFNYESITSYYFASEIFFLKYQIFKKQLLRNRKS